MKLYKYRNCKRNLFILTGFLLSLFDILTDICYTSAHETSSLFPWLVTFLVLQPILYYIYYLLYTTVPVCLEESVTFTMLELLYAYLIQGPIFLFLAEFKLMLTRFYKYTLSKHQEFYGDRTKHDFMSHILVHAVFESIPMLVVQVVHNARQSEWDGLAILSMMGSLSMILYGVYVATIVKDMHMGGHNWIQQPQKEIYFSLPTITQPITYGKPVHSES
jgi:hypothetical protein